MVLVTKKKEGIIMSKTLTVTLATLASGGIDTEKSKAAFADALDSYIAQHELEQEQIGEAVHALFDRPDLARSQGRLRRPRHRDR